MADAEHLEWLLKGRIAWNNKRRGEDFVPDLSGEDIAAKLHAARIVSKDGRPRPQRSKPIQGLAQWL